MRSLAFKETALGPRSGSLASHGETSARACSLRMWVSRRIEKFFCAKRAAAIRKSARSKTQTPREAALGGLCACRARSVLQRLVFQTNFDFAAQNRAVFDDDATRLHTASNSAGAPDLDALAGLEPADHL